jgi:hypothetical protein
VSETPKDWRTHPLVVAAWPVFDKVIGDVRYARISERDLETICTTVAALSSAPQGRTEERYDEIHREWESACERERTANHLLSEANEEIARIDAVILERHTRLSKAVGMDPGYSVDGTLREAIRRINLFNAAPQGRGDVSEEALAWLQRHADCGCCTDASYRYHARHVLASLRPAPSSPPAAYSTAHNKFRVAEKSGVTQVVGRGDVSAECSGSAINDTGISLFSDKGEVRLTFAEWHELAAMIQPVADHPGLARISFDHLRPAPSSEPEKL